jgi:hypothetical protein
MPRTDLKGTGRLPLTDTDRECLRSDGGDRMIEHRHRRPYLLTPFPCLLYDFSEVLLERVCASGRWNAEFRSITRLDVGNRGIDSQNRFLEIPRLRAAPPESGPSF